MANFDFYHAKAVVLKQRLNWIKDSFSKINPKHDEIKLWIKDRLDYFDSEISIIEKLIQKANPAYLPRIKTGHMLLEKELLSASNYLGIMFREGPNENKMSKLIQRMCRESDLPINDFLITFATLEGPAVITARASNPIFYVPDESLKTAYSWIPLFHEIGHIVVRHNRKEIVEALVKIVREHYRKQKISVGPVDAATQQRQEDALNKAEKYWTEGRNNLRLEELFCDCFATYSCGLAYPYFWLDHGISFVEYPKFINNCDVHPPFFARFEACWHILPDSIKNSDYGLTLKTLWGDYLSTSYNATNPELEYGIVCNEDLVYKLTEKSAELVNQFSPSLKQWCTPPSHDPKSTKIDESLAFTLNSLVCLLLHDQGDYPQLENRIVQSILEK